MESDELGRAIEAVLFVAVEPVLPGLLAELLEEPVERVEETLDALAEGYRTQGRGFVLARIAGGARLQTDPAMSPYVERFANRDVSHRLPLSRPWPSWRTANRSRAGRSPRCAVSTSTA
jgi:segregation and condensation protein B